MYLPEWLNDLIKVPIMNDLTLGLLSAKADARHVDQWVKLLRFPNISDMLANLHSPGGLLFKTQSAYFSNISDVPPENSRKADGVIAVEQDQKL